MNHFSYCCVTKEDTSDMCDYREFLEPKYNLDGKNYCALHYPRSDDENKLKSERKAALNEAINRKIFYFKHVTCSDINISKVICKN